MAAYDVPFINFEFAPEMGPWTSSAASMAEQMSQPASARAQMLHGIGAGHCHFDGFQMHPAPADSLDFLNNNLSHNVFYQSQKGQDMTLPPFDLQLPQQGYQHDSPRSESSSQSGDTFSACYTDDLNPQVLHRQSFSTPQIMQEPYFEFPHVEQTPQLPPGIGGGISLGEVQNFEDQSMPLKHNHDLQGSAISEEDAEGESDQEYGTIFVQEPVAKVTPGHEKIHPFNIAESCHDPMSEDFEPDEEDDDDYNPRRRSSSHRPRRPAATKKASQRRRPSNGGVAKIVGPKGRRPSTNSLIRPFPCPLAQYSCPSTFTSKNEWKRHLSTQHVKLGFWRCDMCSVGDAAQPSYNDFNRKDLFTQHLRRMHKNHPLTTAFVTNDAGEPEIADEAILEHQKRCYIVLRANPTQSTCLFESCDKTFRGEGSWEERMEHVGTHMEKDRRAGKSVSCDEWREDLDLRDYLENEGLIHFKDGKWSVGDGIPLRGPVN